MVSLDHHSYTAMLARSSADRDDFALYPEPPQGVFSSGPLDSMGAMPTDPYSGMFPASMAAAFEHQQQQHSPAFHHYQGGNMYTTQPSPGAFDDADLQIPGSNVSSASAPSASSSAVGSPQSHHGQLGVAVAGGMSEWNSHHHHHSHQGGLALTPGIVPNDFYNMAGSEYSSYTHVVDDFAAFDFPSTGPKPPGYVGESRPVSATSRAASSSASSASAAAAAAARLSVDTRSANATAAAARPSLSSPVSFVSPGSASFSSPSVPAWAASPRTPRLSSFFSQSSGHFVPPLQSFYPSLIHPEISGPMPMPGYDNVAFHQHARYPASPSTASSPQPVMRNASRSPYLHDGYQQPQQQYSPFQPPMDGRRPSVHSFPSTASYEGNNGAYSGDETSKEKQRCPHPDCGKTFKDLKAHMLTHQNERPEKCPIQTCEYHVKGFARKYDKNRHTLTHYKGTMVCGFCPGSGSAAEKSFNRADVFKRHLTAVHGVEQTPPNSRKKAAAAGATAAKGLAGYPPDATGKCSTCSQTFSNAQDFYEHLDDCVLRIVQQEDPAEAVNARLLGALENDKDVAQTMQRNNLPTQTQTAAQQNDEDEDEDMDDDSVDEDDDESADRSSPSKRQKGGKSRGLTHSRGGVPLRAKAKGRKNKTRKPGSWGYDKELVTLKKRVMCAFDGPRRLAKDDMMLSTEQEVRIKLSDGKSYTTDLDIYTVARAEGFHSATEEEKGLWVSDDPNEMQYRQMQEHAAMHVKPEHDFDAEVMA